MYYYLHGRISQHLKDSIVVDVNGIGYDVLVSHPDEFPIGEFLFVYVCYIHNDKEEYFVGFKSREEKELFLKLTSVQGIGPKTALGVLSNSSVGRLVKAIDESDANYLRRLPNIGKKSASQIILDLRGKLQLIGGRNSTTRNENRDKAFEALKETYGFKDSELKKVFSEINDTTLSVSDYLRLALKRLNNRGGTKKATLSLRKSKITTMILIFLFARLY